LLKCEGLTSKSDTVYTNIQIIGANMGICLGNNQGNFQLHRFTTSEIMAKSFRRAAFFLTHTVDIPKLYMYTKNELSRS